MCDYVLIHEEARGVIPLEMVLQVVVSQLVWVLGTEPEILEEQYALLAPAPMTAYSHILLLKGILVPFSFGVKLL